MLPISGLPQPSCPLRGRVAVALASALLLAPAIATPPAVAAKRRAGADLGVASVGAPPASLAAGARLSVSFAVRNAGSRRAGATTIGFLLSADARRDAADVPLGTA